jgi:ferric-dicitrate binding protein FerR (iron transport regulator)
MSLIQNIFRRYRDNNATREEQQLVDGWYEYYDQEQDITLTPGEADNIKQSIRQKIILSANGPVTAPAPVRRLWWRYASAAAAVLVIIAAAAIWLSRPAGNDNKSYTYLTTTAGITKKLSMPDGSTLLVRPGSFITFKTAFDDAAREVTMHNGEVYYEVAKDSSRPFIIHTGKLDVKVLGTSFAVRAINGIREQEVVVKEGRVQVSHNTKVLAVLTAGHRLAFDTTTSQFNVQQEESQMAEQFYQGWLILNNQSFAELQVLLHNRYDIILQDPQHKLTKAHFSTMFRPQSSIQNIMQILCAMHGVSYTINGNVVAIR